MPRMPTESKRRRSRGGQPGNQNARKHGAYSALAPTTRADWLGPNILGILESIARPAGSVESGRLAVREALDRLDLSREELARLHLTLSLIIAERFD